jgi:hypothetical protein
LKKYRAFWEEAGGGCWDPNDPEENERGTTEDWQVNNTVEGGVGIAFPITGELE